MSKAADKKRPNRKPAPKWALSLSKFHREGKMAAQQEDMEVAQKWMEAKMQAKARGDVEMVEEEKKD